MERRAKPRDTRPRGGQGIAWLALILSFLSCAMSCVTLLLTWHDGRLSASAQSLFREYRGSGGARPGLLPPIPETTPGADNPASAETPAPAGEERPSDGVAATAGRASDWDALCEKLYRAEGMIRNEDDHVKDFLETLKDEMAELRAKSTVSGARWLDAAAEKFNAVRQEMVDNAPAAARRLHELTTDLQSKARAFQGVTEALGNLRPRRRGGEPAPAVPLQEGPPGDAAPRRGDPQQ